MPIWAAKPIYELKMSFYGKHLSGQHSMQQSCTSRRYMIPKNTVGPDHQHMLVYRGVLSSQVKIPSIHQSTESCCTSSLCRNHATTAQISLRRGQPGIVGTTPEGAVHNRNTRRGPEKNYAERQWGTAVRPLNPRHTCNGCAQNLSVFAVGFISLQPRNVR